MSSRHPSQPIPERRALSAAEEQLALWMLEHGGSDAPAFVSQLSNAHVVSRCACGCASVDFEVKGLPSPHGGLTILGDFLYGADDAPSGVFIFECNGVLAGIEVYSFTGDAPRTLPTPSMLRRA